MNQIMKIIFYVIVFVSISFAQNKTIFKPISGFHEDANKLIEEFLISTENETGRKIAVFDGDGTVLGQTPHYLADECMYAYIKSKPGHRTGLLNEMINQSNVSIPYVQNRIRLLAGLSLNEMREMGKQCFKERYSDKIFEPMRQLINVLKQNGFEVWIVTGSPEAMYQGFLSEELEIPVTNIIGVKSVIRHGIISEEIVHPVPQDRGKMEAIETFIQDKPLIVGGNSRGDKEMIEFSKGLRIIVNPDTFVAPDQTESISDYAKKEGWIILRINDTPDDSIPWISTEDYKIKRNKTNIVK